MLANFLLTADAVLLGAVLATDREAWVFLGHVAQFFAFGMIFWAILFGVAGGLGYISGLAIGTAGQGFAEAG